MELRGRTALVTGGSGGIGAELTRRLTEAGAAVAVHHRDSEADARAAEGALVVQADLGDAAACEELIDRIEAELGPLDILAANAGAGGQAPWQEVDAETFDRMYAVNLRAPFLLARRVLPGMVEVGRLGTPAEVADLALAILRNGYLTSKVVAIDGGMYPA